MNNLQTRFVQFASGVFQTAAPLMKNTQMMPAVKRLVISSSSVGAIYYDAQSAISSWDFNNKIRLALIELQETHYWLHFLSDNMQELPELVSLEQETEELIKILNAVSKKNDPRRKAMKKPILLPYLF